MDSPIQLFILPFAGSRAAQFDEFVSDLGENVETYTIEYAGRGKRAKEQYYTDYHFFLDDISGLIKKYRDYNRPYAILGYSIGGLFAYDLISKGYLEQPEYLFICACEDNQKPLPQISKLPEDEFWDRVIQLGGVDKRLIAKRKLLKLFSSALRADFNIAEQHRYLESDKLISCPVSILYSETDTPFDTIKNWQSVCQLNIQFHELVGDHFFLLQQHEKVAKVIRSHLKIR